MTSSIGLNLTRIHPWILSRLVRGTILETGVLGELKTYYTKIRYQNPDEVASQGFWYKKGFNLNDDVIAIVLIQRRGLVENRRVLVLSYFATCASYASIMLLKSIIVSIMT